MNDRAVAPLVLGCISRAVAFPLFLMACAAGPRSLGAPSHAGPAPELAVPDLAQGKWAYVDPNAMCRTKRCRRGLSELDDMAPFEILATEVPPELWTAVWDHAQSLDISHRGVPRTPPDPLGWCDAVHFLNQWSDVERVRIERPLTELYQVGFRGASGPAVMLHDDGTVSIHPQLPLCDGTQRALRKFSGYRLPTAAEYAVAVRVGALVTDAPPWVEPAAADRDHAAVAVVRQLFEGPPPVPIRYE